MDDRRRDGGTNSTLRTKEQGKHLTLNEHDDDDVVNKALPSVDVMSRQAYDRLKCLFSMKDNIDLSYLSQRGF